MSVISLISFTLSQLALPIVSTLLIAVSIFWLVKKRYSRKYAYIISTIVLFVSIGFWWSQFIPGNPKLFGPADGPAISFSNIIKFYRNAAAMETVKDIARDPKDVPVAILRTTPDTIKIELTSKEVIGTMADGVTFNYWTFNGTVPGPFLRVREGDTIELTLKNDQTSIHNHNIDLHAVTGPGGGATVTNVKPGESKTFSFKALNPGLYVYHCAHPNVATHMAHGMYGLILVEPKEGLPPVDKEFYIMQGEFYNAGGLSKKGLQIFDEQKMLNAQPQYIVFNGRVGGVTGTLTAETGQRVRLYVGNGGVNLTSSFHVIGEIFDTVYPEGAIGSGSDVHKNIQSTLVPAGGSTIVEFTADVPGKYIIVDHALARLDRGAWGTFDIIGPANYEVFEGVKDNHIHGH